MLKFRRKVDIKLPFTHPELYEDIGIKPPK